jgi:hypothetical protein
VIGNPPWVDWANLSPDYREISEALWEMYELFEFSGYDARTVHDDICILMTYVALDEYLTDDGKLGFVLPQQLFQSHQGGYGFRRFSIPKKTQEGSTEYHPLRVGQVDDLSEFNPFDASNRTAVVGIQKGKEMEYPVPYRIWKHQEGIHPRDTLEEVLGKVEFVDLVAEPVQEEDVQSEWLTLEPGAISAIRNIMGESKLVSREGVNTLGADGIYHIEIVETRDDTAVIQNLPNELTLITNNLPSGYHRDYQLLKEKLFPAVQTLKSCLHISKFMLEHIEVNTEAVEDKRYQYIYSVEEVNKKVLDGVPFRKAYQQIGKAIEEGKFEPSQDLNHTHEGSIGNLCNDEIRRKFTEVFNKSNT